MLDIGAGAGRLLRMIRRLSAKRLELFANEIEFDRPTRQRLEADGISMIEGPIEQATLTHRFDVITGIHVIEHVLDPRAVFAWIAAHLVPGGVLYFETPDASAFCGRLFGSRWGMTHFPRHINLFGKRQMAALAQGAGLQVVRQGNTTSAPAWNMSIRNSLGMDALSKHRSPLEMFNYSNVVTLGLFTVVDAVLLGLRIPTSTQTLVAVRPA